MLAHRVRVLPPTSSALASADGPDAVVVDGTLDLSAARSLCGVARTISPDRALLLVVTEGGLPAVAPAWGMDDVVLQTAGPAEVDARIRLLRPHAEAEETDEGAIVVGHLTIDEQSYTAKYRGRTLDLTFKEFELLRYLAANADHVFTRQRLLSEVWGYDYYGGTRTVDVHVRRLRAKLGDHESVIGTVRNVGYRLLRGGEQSHDDDDTED
nr:response regulator transcription factor [Pseudoclavibacter chungangensis]